MLPHGPRPPDAASIHREGWATVPCHMGQVPSVRGRASDMFPAKGWKAMTPSEVTENALMVWGVIVMALTLGIVRSAGDDGAP